MEKLIEQLKEHEGFSRRTYIDSVGKVTVGYGRNLDGRPLTREEGDYLLRNDIKYLEEEMYLAFPSYRLFTSPRRDALLNMVYNLGLTRFRRFEKMHEALGNGDFLSASEEMMDSKWARQVKGRALELAAQMETGRYK